MFTVETIVDPKTGNPNTYNGKYIPRLNKHPLNAKTFQ